MHAWNNKEFADTLEMKLYDLVKAVTGRDVENRYSFDSFVIENGLVPPMEKPLEAMLQEFMEHQRQSSDNRTSNYSKTTKNKFTKKHLLINRTILLRSWLN